MIIDTFIFNDELDLLEARLTELEDVVDMFVLVESHVDHQDNEKPLHFRKSIREEPERWERWHGKLQMCITGDMPSAREHPDPWAREHAQREWIYWALKQQVMVEIPGDAVVMQSDVDEIPRPLYVRNCRPNFGELISFPMAGLFWAIDWLHPEPWMGTVAARWDTLEEIHRRIGAAMSWMRDSRNSWPFPDPGAGIPTSRPICPPADVEFAPAGWHFSWLGGPERAMKKVGSFCHPEVEDRLVDAIDDGNRYWRLGEHVDGAKMIPVEVDHRWPKWIIDNAPENWFRPR